MLSAGGCLVGLVRSAESGLTQSLGAAPAGRIALPWARGRFVDSSVPGTEDADVEGAVPARLARGRLGAQFGASRSLEWRAAWRGCGGRPWVACTLARSARGPVELCAPAGGR